MREMGRQARGVRAIRLAEGDVVVGMSVLRENGLVLTVSETATAASRTPKITACSVAAAWVSSTTTLKKYGNVAAIKVVDLDDDIILIADDGVIIRIEAGSIRICCTSQQGCSRDEGQRGQQGYHHGPRPRMTTRKKSAP